MILEDLVEQLLSVPIGVRVRWPIFTQSGYVIAETVRLPDVLPYISWRADEP